MVPARILLFYRIPPIRPCWSIFRLDCRLAELASFSRTADLPSRRTLEFLPYR
jgi:hypothetical protein